MYRATTSTGNTGAYQDGQASLGAKPHDDSGPHRAAVVPVIPIPECNGPSNQFLHDIYNLRSLVQSNVSLAIRTGHEYLLDKPVQSFPELLAKNVMSGPQQEEYNKWTSSNFTYMPVSVLRAGRFYPKGTRLPRASEHYPPNVQEQIYNQHRYLEEPLRHIFRDQGADHVNPSTVIWCVHQGRDDCLKLAQAIGMVLDKKDKIDRVRCHREGKWPTAEELAELVVIGKIIRVIDGRIEWMAVRGPIGGRVARYEYHESLRNLRMIRLEFATRETDIWSGRWKIRGHKKEGEM